MVYYIDLKDDGGKISFNVFLIIRFVYKYFEIILMLNLIDNIKI